MASALKPVDKDSQRVQSMFAEIAPRYDLLNHLLSLGIDIRWRKFVVKNLRLDQSAPVLDCCTGTGDLALLIAKKLAGRAKVFGTDFCEPMLEIARQKQARLPAQLPVEFSQADAQQLPFPNSTFQCVTVAFGLRNVQDTDQGILEMVRVCRPGGQIAILEFSKPRIPGLKHAYQAYFTKVLPLIGQRLARNNQSAYEYLPNSVLQFPSGEGLVKVLEMHGLSNVRMFPLTLGVATLYLGEC
ncbi:MAG: bifunctional demethylmenaquinone methyltransferase/2-methoxy-6-polyprenyl-1,4-benzoquinol methylase UbiE [Planctomycetales bacterium]|nr:bifunctional demethylmenaquinone methyltransferase/2-methoxy-6-polyprenyl-1,4-benzoquinol methylase UbiE [Planctomycetales bacterium]